MTPYHLLLHDFKSFSLSFLQVAAIGPTTAEALVNAGVQVDASANKPNSESLVQAIRQAGQT